MSLEISEFFLHRRGVYEVQIDLKLPQLQIAPTPLH